MPSKLRKLNILLLVAVSLSGCATIYNPTTQRQEYIFIDTESEVDLGRRMDADIRQKLKISNDPAANFRLNRIGQKVAGYSQRKDITYHFSVIADDELNAFATPGGFVYVNSGLLKAATDDELACVLAHEIGHIAAKHSVKKMQAVLGYQLIMGLAMGITKTEKIGSAVDVVFNVVNLGYSRSDELLADKLAVKYAAGSGFNPSAIISFFEKLKKEAEKKGPGLNLAFLSSHPPLEQRIANAKEQISLLKK